MQSFNVAIIGDPQTGKTSLISKYLKDTSKSLQTQGYITKLTIQTSLGQKQILMWECSGQTLQERQIAYQNADLILILFDLASQPTTDNIKKWNAELASNSVSKPVIICGNKWDLIQNKPLQIDSVVHEISVKLDRNLDRLMTDILRRLTGQLQLTVLKCKPKTIVSERLCTSGMTQYGTFQYTDE